MSTLIQLIVSVPIVVVAVCVAYVQWHRMKAISAIRPAQKWILQSCAAILADHRNSVAVRSAADRLWRLALNSDLVMRVVALKRGRGSVAESTLSEKDQSILDAPVKAAALCALAFNPIYGPLVLRRLGEAYDPSVVDKLMESPSPKMHLARQVKSEERVVARAISRESRENRESVCVA